VPASATGEVDRITDTVLQWWTDAARDLPWRGSRDPWEVLVSEVMAQQTQVDRVIPKWQRFISRFPNVETAARAEAGELIELWDGLGYNRRALQLHRCAQMIQLEHAGLVPDDLEALLALPGIGPYTARAVLAFAFERDVAVVDTNVGRVFARLRGDPLGSAPLQSLANSYVPEGKGWEWNQALLDFGATICLKRTPCCSSCPLREQCTWKGIGPDPAIGSAAVGGPQSRFEGSDRQGRGRLVAALRTGSISTDAAAATMGFDDDLDRAMRVLDGLITDGLVVQSTDLLSLPR
jgi:A/G-specific adenine glycosylase